MKQGVWTVLQIGLMIEGQNGLNWQRWQKLLALAEELGFAFVFRSDHFTNAAPPDQDSLELWTSLTYAASHTQRIEFGSLVTPVTFRHPSITARAAAAVDDLSNGRLVLGIGAGWQDREHHNFGIPFPPKAVRFEMLREYLEIVTRLLRNNEPVKYQGKHYALDDAILLPRPRRPGGPSILVGGNGKQRTLPLAALYADEWNAVFAGPEKLEQLEKHLDRLLHEAGRAREAVRRSVMIGTFLARSSRALEERLESKQTTAEQSLESGVLIGTADSWAEQLQRYASVGVQRIMLQWLDLDDLEGLRLVGQEVLPAFEAG
ncbi:MAG TPA: LLM class F420-dependent oxidoreductase [Chloroflexi bacterium]|jgi:F420-dependent oxidoreductase-like protein|nr:LLM class F420-dependent oxidoreductase [Chloroflexota bacterium]